jgi:hypothetical protein
VYALVELGLRTATTILILSSLLLLTTTMSIVSVESNHYSNKIRLYACNVHFVYPPCRLKILSSKRQTVFLVLSIQNQTYRLSQKWRTNYLLPYPGCLNVHEKNMEKNFQTKNKLLLFLLLTVMQCKERCTRTSLPCNVTVVDLKYFFRFPKLLNSPLCRIRYW